MGEQGDGRLQVEDLVEGRVLRVVSKTMVKPSVETPRENRWLEFSNLDTIWMPFYTPLISIYKAETQVPLHRDTGEHLRESLRRALALFYPLAGRVVTSPAPGILCNDAGAPFVEASIDATLAELQYESNFQPSFRLSGMAEAGLGDYPRLSHDSTSTRPALIVQMTRFACGGITLASNWAHPVADGLSGFHFMKSWAELARGEEVSLIPVHERTLVKPRHPLILSNPFAADQPTHNVEKASTLQGTMTQGQVTQSKSFHHVTPTVRVVEITEQDVDEIKRDVEEEEGGGECNLSRVCCVSAHVWRAIVKARGLKGEALTRFWILVEGRKQMGLPTGYFGNAIGGRYATTTVGKVVSEVGSSSRLVQAAIRRCTKEWFQEFVDWVEAKREREYPGMVLGFDHECGSSWQNRFGYYELDFGFGPPVWSARNASAAWDGLVVFLPSARSAESFTAMVHAAPDVMAKLLPLLHRSSHSDS